LDGLVSVLYERQVLKVCYEVRLPCHKGKDLASAGMRHFICTDSSRGFVRTREKQRCQRPVTST